MMNEILTSVFEEAISQSQIGVALVTFTDNKQDKHIGYVANEDYYSDLLEDMELDFVAYDGVEEFEDMYADEDIHLDSVQPLTLQMIEEGVMGVDGHRTYTLTSPRMVEKCGCECIAFQLSYGLLIVRTDYKRLIIRTEKKLGDFTISELPSIISENEAEFTYPNDEEEGVIEYNN